MLYIAKVGCKVSYAKYWVELEGWRAAQMSLNLFLSLFIIVYKILKL